MILDCPVAAECGGCALIGSTYDEQLRWKAERVREALAGLPQVPVEPCVPAPRTEAYRMRAKLAVRATAGGVRIGLHRRGSNTIVDLEPCRVQSRPLQRAIERLRGWVARHRLARPAGPLFYLDLREGAEERVHVTLVVDGEIPIDSLPLGSLASDWSELSGVAVNFGSADSSYPLGPVTRPARGEASFRIEVSGVELEVPAGGFFQVAPGALPSVHAHMAEHLGSEGALLDLYCGVGVHGLALARGARLFGVEEVEPLILAARRNAQRAGVQARFEVGRVEAVLPRVVAEKVPHRVVLNPGRSGCRSSALDTIVATRFSRVAYLSCNPQTLARDLERLTAGGYRVERVVPFDLMPQTDHIEALALLR